MANLGTCGTKEDFAVAVVFQVAAQGARNNPQVSPRVIFRDVINKLAPELGMGSEYLFEKTRQFLRVFPTMQGQEEESNRRIKLLAEASNRLNAEAFQKAPLAPKEEGAKSLFVLGSNHLEMIRKIFSK